MPVVSLTSSSSTSSSCTQLAASSSNESTETGDDLDLNCQHDKSKTTGISPPQLYQKESLLNIGIEMNPSSKEDKPYYNTISDAVTEPLLAIKYNEAKMLNSTENCTSASQGLTNGVRNVAVKTPSSSAMSFLENGRKISDINKNMHKTSIIDYKTEARKLDQTRRIQKL